ncbi:MAG: hypothetical protein ACK5EU_02500, partial [Pseudanabaena sp.]
MIVLLNTHKPDRLFLKSNSDRPSSPTKPDRLFPQIKQRSPLITNKPDRLFPNINQRSPLTTLQSDILIAQPFKYHLVIFRQIMN